MKNQFAKLFDLPCGNQVLYTVNYNSENEEEPYQLKIRTDFSDCTAEMSLSFKEEKKALKSLLSQSQESAGRARVSMSKLFTNEQPN